MWTTSSFRFASAVAFVLLIINGRVQGKFGRVFDCPTTFGNYIEPTSCESYWICNNNNSIAATCSFGLIYDHITQNCNWPDDKVCTRIEGKVIRNWTPPSAPQIVVYSDSMAAPVDIANGSSAPIRLLNAKEIIAKWNSVRNSSRHGMSSGNGMSGMDMEAPPVALAVTGPPDYALPKHFTLPPKKVYTVKPIGSKPVRCDRNHCRLPDCYCDAQRIPGGLTVESTPQIVMVTFDDAANGANADLLDFLFAANRTNPNGCPITGTFFLANPSTDYNVVKKWAKKGHEIASHSLTHKDFSHYTEDQWKGEIVGEAELAHEYGNVNLSQIVGMRAPYLDTGGNTMFRMLWNNGFLYDSSIPSSQTDPPLWPYTLDAPIPQNCFSNCPSGYFPGLWEVPMTDILALNDAGCSMYDACTFPSDPVEISDVFWGNLMKHYGSNRAPFLLSAHTAWYFNSEIRVKGMLDFMEKALALGDVWFLSVKQAIQWIRNPTELTRLGGLKEWQCGNRSP